MQRGSALIVSLFFLALITLLSLSSIGRSTVQLRMASNDQDRGLAFQAAESTLRATEKHLNEDFKSVDDLLVMFNKPNVGFYLPGKAPDINSSTTWSKENSLEYANFTGPTSSKPRYIVEWLHTPSSGELNSCYSSPCYPPPLIFRITVKSTGKTDSAIVMLQEDFVAAPGS